jgi:hypothetical protein
VDHGSGRHEEFEAEVASRFGLLPNFFRSAQAAPELIQQLWGFARAGYLDNPMPSVFKERLFVWLSRFCPMRYCIVRHVGFLLGHGHGNAAGDASALPQTIGEIVGLLRRPSPWQREMHEVYARLEGLTCPDRLLARLGSDLEDAVFACAAVMFAEPARSERARRAMLHAVGPRRFEFFGGCLAFIRTAHYWTILHPEIETEDDMRLLMRGHEDLARLLLEDPEADRCEMGQRLFEELTTLRELNERQELERAKQALEEKDRQKDEFIAVIAHELRNPLAAIRSATDTLGRLQMPGSNSGSAGAEPGSPNHCHDPHAGRSGDASRTGLGKESVRLERLALADLLSEVVNEQQPRAQRQGCICLASARQTLLRQSRPGSAPADSR